MPSFIRSALCLTLMTFMVPLHSQSDPPRPTTANANSASGDSPTTVSATDRKFLARAMQACLAGIETGTLAWSKGSGGEIKLLGRKMYDAHSKTLRELQSLARKKSVLLPQTLDASYEATAGHLSRASGEEFDRMYMENAGVGDYTAVKRLFSQGAKSGDPDIRAFAQRALAHMEGHLKMAQALSTKG